MLRTIGRYIGIIKRQAQEFRTQFDEAIRDSEFEQVKKEFEDLKSGAETTIRDASRDFENEVQDLNDLGRDIDRDIHKSLSDDETKKADADALDWADEHNRSILDSEATSASEQLNNDPVADDGRVEHDAESDIVGDDATARPESSPAKAGAAS